MPTVQSAPATAINAAAPIRAFSCCSSVGAISNYAISHAEEGDLIVLAGKGHEDYQEIRGVKYPMDERVIIEELLAGGLEHI